MVTIRPATGRDCLTVAGAMRLADRQELEAAGATPLQSLWDGLESSVEPIVGCYEDDRPVAMAGVVADPGDPAVGYVWMLGTEEMATRPMHFLRTSKPIVESWNRQFPVLTNHVDARNTLHIKWLRWLGFVFINRAPHGPLGLPFLHFVRISPDGIQCRGRSSISADR